MNISKDTLTTVLGGASAVLNGVEPVISAVSGVPTTNDWVRIGLSILFAVFGWATNKGGVPTNG